MYDSCLCHQERKRQHAFNVVYKKNLKNQAKQYISALITIHKRAYRRQQIRGKKISIATKLWTFHNASTDIFVSCEMHRLYIWTRFSGGFAERCNLPVETSKERKSLSYLPLQ